MRSIARSVSLTGPLPSGFSCTAPGAPTRASAKAPASSAAASSSARSGSGNDQPFDEQARHDERQVPAGVVGRPDGGEHAAEVARDRALVDRTGDLAVLDPEAAGAARIVA